MIYNLWLTPGFRPGEYIELGFDSFRDYQGADTGNLVPRTIDNKIIYAIYAVENVQDYPGMKFNYIYADDIGRHVILTIGDQAYEFTKTGVAGMNSLGPVFLYRTDPGADLWQFFSQHYNQSVPITIEANND